MYILYMYMCCCTLVACCCIVLTLFSCIVIIVIIYFPPLHVSPRLPDYACKFLEMCLMVTADHGPAVSGAHNTIITARAGKDLVSSLASGILTIGDRFGGALDGAAQQFREAYDSNMLPMEFVNSMRKQHKLIMGIGHKVKSVSLSR